MMARARRLSVGDELPLDCGGGFKMRLKVAGIVDLNWHMVTSRGLVRGLNGSPVMTDGPAFVSIETANWLDPRPFLASVNLTHLWVEYEPAFLAEKGVFRAGREVERGGVGERIERRLAAVVQELPEPGVRGDADARPDGLRGLVGLGDPGEREVREVAPERAVEVVGAEVGDLHGGGVLSTVRSVGGRA